MAEDMARLNAALEAAAQSRITVLVAAGDNGAGDGSRDGHRHVDFPASSPWVLSVGGTSLKSEHEAISSETVWRSDGNGGATGGGVSDKFDRPDWQSAVPVPDRADGKAGRGVPDVVASADPKIGVPVVVHGNISTFGGTTVSLSVWAGLIARLDQALGANIGYLTPRLYKEMSNAGLFHTISLGNNSVSGVQGYSAGPGWSPVAGWGSPDGMKLLSWLRDHPEQAAAAPAVACRSS